MTRSLMYKWLFIAAVILMCLYGIFDIPKSGADFANNFKKNIRLGLDLRGGSQLVMRVEAQDAFKAEADATIARMKDEFKKAGVDYSSIDRNDPQTLQQADSIAIDIKGVPGTKSA